MATKRVPSQHELTTRLQLLEVRYENLKRRHQQTRDRIDYIYRRPYRFIASRLYHRFIKRDILL